MLKILLLGLFYTIVLGAGTTRPSSATLKKLVNDQIEKNRMALMAQEQYLSFQKVMAPMGYIVVATLPNQLTLRSNVFSPSTTFHVGTVFEMTDSHIVHGSIRSVLSAWSITLPKNPIAVPMVPSIVSKGTDVIVPEGFDLYLFDQPSFDGTCVHPGVHGESYNIGSLMLISKTTRAVVTVYTSPDFDGCEIALSNGTLLGGIQSMVVHVERVMITSAVDGMKRVFSAGHYRNIDLRHMSIIAQISVNRAYARLCMHHESEKCWHVVDGYTDTLLHSFATYDIPFGYELLIRSKKGIIALISTGSVSTSMCSPTKQCTITVRQIEIHRPPMVCNIYGCYLIYGEFSGNLAIDTIIVPPGVILRIGFTLNPFATFTYGEGTHHLSWCILGVCTSKLIELKYI